MTVTEYHNLQVILGNSSKRFSGVTSTMLQVLGVQKNHADILVLGHHHLPTDVPSLSFFQAIRALRTPLPSGQVRVFHARRNDEMIQALLLKFLFRAKLKIVFTSTAQRPKTWLTRFLMRRMDGLISTCQAAADYMPDPPDVIIPHGIDTQRFDEPVDLSSAPFGSETNVIGIFGRVRAQKGVDLLVEAAIELLPENPDWAVVVVGQVTDDQAGFHSALVTRLQQAGLEHRVYFTGELPYEKVVAWFKRVSIVCALSTNEGFGLTVLEALAASKPVIATRAGAWPDILGHQKVGELIHVGDRSALKDALVQLMSDAELRHRYGQSGRQLVYDRYTVEREALQLLDFYQRIAAD